MALNSTQRRLRAEIEEIAAIVRMDHWAIGDYEATARTPHLQAMRQQLVRGEIIQRYTLIDELLSVLICEFYFWKPDRGFSFRELWRTKRFRVFNHYILDEMYLLPKTRLVNAVRVLPKDVRDNIDRINALRNAIAHSFFPENRRQYAKQRRVIYRDVSIFSVDGIKRFEEDSQLVIDYLMDRAFG